MSKLFQRMQSDFIEFFKFDDGSILWLIKETYFIVVGFFASATKWFEAKRVERDIK